jgi:hypothetical protein
LKFNQIYSKNRYFEGFVKSKIFPPLAGGDEGMDIKNQPVLGPTQLEGHSLMLSYRVSAPIPEEPKSLFSVDRILLPLDKRRLYKC